MIPSIGTGCFALVGVEGEYKGGEAAEASGWTILAEQTAAIAREAGVRGLVCIGIIGAVEQALPVTEVVRLPQHIHADSAVTFGKAALAALRAGKAKIVGRIVAISAASHTASVS